eukprot:6470932-Amphidinium_carterae.1
MMNSELSITKASGSWVLATHPGVCCEGEAVAKPPVGEHALHDHQLYAWKTLGVVVRARNTLGSTSTPLEERPRTRALLVWSPVNFLVFAMRCMKASMLQFAASVELASTVQWRLQWASTLGWLITTTTHKSCVRTCRSVGQAQDIVSGQGSKSSEQLLGLLESK